MVDEDNLIDEVDVNMRDFNNVVNRDDCVGWI